MNNKDLQHWFDMNFINRYLCFGFWQKIERLILGWFMYTLSAKSLAQSEFEYFGILQKSEKIDCITEIKNIFCVINNVENLLTNCQ